MVTQPRFHRRQRGGRRPLSLHLTAVGPVVALALLVALSAAAQEPDEPSSQPPDAPADAPADEISFDELLAAEEAAAAAEAALLARRSRIPFEAQAESLQGLPAGMAALMMTSQPGGQVVSSIMALPLGRPVAPTPRSAAPSPAADEGPPPELVVLLVEIDGPSLLGPGAADAAELELFAYALAGGGVRGFLAQRLDLDLTEVGEALAAGGIRLVGHLELPPGAYHLRVLVHERTSQRFGLTHLPLSVSAGSALSPPLVAESAADAGDTWLDVVEAPHGTYGAVDFGDLLQRAGTPLPSALPLLAGDQAELDVLITRGAQLPRRLTARLLDVAFQPAAAVPVSVVARSPTELEGFDRLRVRLPLDEIEFGSYHLTLEGEIDGIAIASPELPLVALRNVGGAVVWTDIQRRLAQGESAPPLELTDGRGRRHDARVERAIVTAYRAVLQRLANGDRDGAAADLARIESEVVAAVPADPFAPLDAARRSVLDAIAAAEPEALLPVALLHADVYRRQRAQNEFGLGTRSRLHAAAAVERYAATSELQEAGAYASAVLATLGDELQRAQVQRAARELLERARTLDAENRYALLQLAVGMEKTADYAGAVGALRSLVAIDPKAPEGRLRLAINLLRIGQSGEATTVLDRLVREVNPDWVLTVAYETLAAERLRQGDAAAAAQLLRSAVGRLPGQPRLALQLAYALERDGRTREATEVLQRLEEADSNGPSPRHQYHQWPQGDREALEQRLVQAGLVRLPRLSTALSGTAAGSRR